MKKALIGIVGILLGAAVAVAIMVIVLPKSNTENKNNKSNTTTKNKKTNTTQQNKNDDINPNQQTQNTQTNTSTQNTNTNTSTQNTNANTNNTQQQNNTQNDGYEIIVSKKDLTIKKATSVTFEVTFTNPDESSIREYVHCNDQNNIVVVKYSDIKDKKMTVEVEGLKTGTTEIEISDYNYPNKKELVKVNVIE